jgi:STE24 endopeptidase
MSARLPAALALTAATAAGGMLVALRRELRRAAPPSAAPARLGDWFDPAALRRNRRFRRGTWALAVASAPVAPAVTLVLAQTGPRWRPTLVRAVGGRAPLAGAGVAIGLTAAVRLATLPSAAGRYGWGRHHGLITQGARSWAADVGKAAAVEGLLAGLFGTALAAMLRRSPRLWWLGLAALGGVVSAALAALSPLLLEPLFQKARRLEDPELREEVLALARRAGVPAREVRVSDASRRTTAANAYVSGLGRTRHIVLFDTLLRDLPREEVRFVIAHELAHVRRRHVARSLAWTAALGVPGCLALFALVGWRTGWEQPDADLVVRRLALVLAAAGVAGPVLAPVGAWASRAREREADWAAIQATGEPEAAIGAHRRLMERALGVPDPPRWIQLLFGSHPTTLERIGLALRAKG